MTFNTTSNTSSTPWLPTRHPELQAEENLHRDRRGQQRQRRAPDGRARRAQLPRHKKSPVLAGPDVPRRFPGHGERPLEVVQQARRERPGFRNQQEQLQNDKFNDELSREAVFSKEEADRVATHEQNERGLASIIQQQTYCRGLLQLNNSTPDLPPPLPPLPPRPGLSFPGRSTPG